MMDSYIARKQIKSNHQHISNFWGKSVEMCAPKRRSPEPRKSCVGLPWIEHQEGSTILDLKGELKVIKNSREKVWTIAGVVVTMMTINSRTALETSDPTPPKSPCIAPFRALVHLENINRLEYYLVVIESKWISIHTFEMQSRECVFMQKSESINNW